VEKTKILGFAGYKVGMAHVVVPDTLKSSPTFGQDIAVPVTILDCPPLLIVGIRAYIETNKGLESFAETWAKNLPKNLQRKVKVNSAKTEEKLSVIEKNIEKISKIRVIVATQPEKAGLRKKTPEIFELEVGGKTAKEKFEFAKQLLGKEVSVKDFVNEGELVDVVAVTKGKGTAGPVKRFGIKIQPRKAHQKLRHVGSLGAEGVRRVLWTVPMAGQLGFQTRTEYNKRVLKILSGKEINPKSGFMRYGIVRGDAVLLKGSVPGPKKRLVLLRHAIRPPKAKLVIQEIKQIVT
jgi:large subunit ribosomal protein L3